MHLKTKLVLILIKQTHFNLKTLNVNFFFLFLKTEVCLVSKKMKFNNKQKKRIKGNEN